MCDARELQALKDRRVALRARAVIADPKAALGLQAEFNRVDEIIRLMDADAVAREKSDVVLPLKFEQSLKTLLRTVVHEELAGVRAEVAELRRSVEGLRAENPPRVVAKNARTRCWPAAYSSGAEGLKRARDGGATELLENSLSSLMGVLERADGVFDEQVWDRLIKMQQLLHEIDPGRLAMRMRVFREDVQWQRDNEVRVVADAANE